MEVKILTLFQTGEHHVMDCDRCKGGQGGVVIQEHVITSVRDDEWASGVPGTEGFRRELRRPAGAGKGKKNRRVPVAIKGTVSAAVSDLDTFVTSRPEASGAAGRPAEDA